MVPSNVSCVPTCRLRIGFRFVRSSYRRGSRARASPMVSIPNRRSIWARAGPTPLRNWIDSVRTLTGAGEVVEEAEGGGDHLTLRAGISPVETGEEPTAGIEVGGEFWRWVQSRGRLQPFEQARFEVLEHRDLAHILARRKHKRTPYLLQALDKLVAIKGHSSSHGRSSRLP